MITKQTIILIMLGLFLATLGIWMHTYGFVFAGFFLLSFLAASRILFGPVKGHLKSKIKASRTLPKQRVMEDDIIDIDLRTKAEAGTQLVEVFENLPYYSEVHEGGNDQFYTFNKGETRRFNFRLQTPLRGHFEVGPLTMRHSDFSFLYYQEEDLLGKEDLFVYPETLDINRMEISSGSLRHYSGPYLSNQPGTSNEFFAIREYTRHDPYNRINWKAYAKTKKLMVNEFEKENICDALILVDSRLQTGIGSMTNNPLKYEIKAAMSVASALLKSGNRVSMVTFGEGCELLPPAYGHTQLDLFRAVLTRTQPKGNTTLWQAVYQATPYLYKRTTIVIITTQDLDHTSINTIKILFEREFDVRLITIPSAVFENKALGFKTARNWLADIELQNNLFYLKESGAKVYDWDLYEPIDSVIQRMNLHQKLLRGVFV